MCNKFILISVFLFSVLSFASLASSSLYEVGGPWVNGYDCEGAELPTCDDVGENYVPQGAFYVYCLCSGGSGCRYRSGEPAFCQRQPNVTSSACSYRYLSGCRTWYSYNEVEADSIKCQHNGGTWKYNPATGTSYCDDGRCDSTFSCIEYSGVIHCDDVPSTGQINCVNGTCSGLPYSRWWSEKRSECSNECGQDSNYVISSDTLVSFGASCQDSVKCSDEKYCVNMGSTFAVYNKCSVGPEQVGNFTTSNVMASIIQTGNGTCQDNGFDDNDVNNDNNNNNNNNNDDFNNVLNPNNHQVQNGDLSDDCLIYGVNCPEDFYDTTSYEDPINRSPDNCFCQPFDGMGFVSQIVCPDGSRTTFFGSCSDWQKAFSSSSGLSSSSVAQNPPTSSGGQELPTSSGGLSSDTSFAKYPDYPTDTRSTNRNVQAVLGGSASVLSDIKKLLQELKNYISQDEQFTYSDNLSKDSFELVLDTTRYSVIDSLFSVLDTAKLGLDTSKVSQTGVCPCITANVNTPFTGNAQLRIDMANIGGFNICSVIRALIIGFASVVSFFVGYRLFSRASI